ncbi:hypothetical protein CY35_09G098000 [Sphagnum magellanicum]|nr:hypothetical protein CY35_09G098000 [Sphagnum magellanicum]
MDESLMETVETRAAVTHIAAVSNPPQRHDGDEDAHQVTEIIRSSVVQVPPPAPAPDEIVRSPRRPRAEAPLVDAVELSRWRFYRAVIVEFAATLLFVYVGVSTVIGVAAASSNEVVDGGGVGLLGIAWAFGGMIFVLVYCTAGISGGHINPAVTFALLLARKVTIPRTVCYMIAQCAGAVCGVGVVRAVQGSTLFHEYGGGANYIHQGYSLGKGLVAEMLGTLLLVFTVMSATDPERKEAQDAHDNVPVLAPLAIGFTVFLVHLATIPITGTGINPARSFASAAILNKPQAWHQHWIFWVGPFLGATLAAIFHQFVMRRGPFKSSKSST